MAGTPAPKPYQNMPQSLTAKPMPRPAPTTTTTPAFNPAPLTPTAKGMAQYQQVQKSVAKKRAAAAAKRAANGGIRGPKSAPNDPSGTGGPNDPAWQHLADLYKNGLPG